MTLRGRLLSLANEWELYADLEQHPRARKAFKDAAAGLRRELSKKASPLHPWRPRSA